MPAVALSGQDTIIINNYVFQGLADGNVAELTFPNDISNVKVGKNGNAVYALNTSGNIAEFTCRAVRGGSDDNFLLGLLNSQQNNFVGFTLMVGQFIKKLGDGQGNLTSDTYNVTGGIFQKQPEVKSNVEGDTEQSIAIYKIRFANQPVVRALT